MDIQVLGASGGDYDTFRSTSLLINENILLDAGAVVSLLRIDEILRIENVILTHPHIDHVKDLAMISDLIVNRRKTPLSIWGTEHTISVLKRHLFNNLLWPDFTSIPSRKNPAIRYKILKEEMENKIDSINVFPVRVNHTVETMGFIIKEKDSSFVISGDTGPTERLWKFVNRTENLKCLFIELSFPDSRKEIAKRSKHLTPMMLRDELMKIDKKDIPVLLYHMKPLYIETLKKEVQKYFFPNIVFLNSNDRFRL